MTKPDIVNREAGKKYQQFLNANRPTGYPSIVEDGLCGKATTALTYVVFQNKNASAVTDETINRIALELGEKNSTRIRTVGEVEAGGAGWDKAGFPTILYERHYFWQLTKGRVGITPFSNSQRSQKYTIDADKDEINDSWENVAAACYYDARAAFQSFSMSKFQIMGKWYDKLGYKEPWEMALAVSKDEGVHYELLAKWIKYNGKLAAFKAISASAAACQPFAEFWNGSAYAKHNYHGRLAGAYAIFSRRYGL